MSSKTSASRENLTIGFTQDSDGGTDNKLTNCYSYVQLPSLEAHPSIRALYAVGGTGEINPAGTSDGTLNHGKTTYENCYFLTSEVLAGYYFLELTPKKEGTDILHLIYTDTDDVPYRLDVTVHVTAAAELRPSRLFMFPNDTVSIAVRATDKAGHPLDERLQNGKLTLKGDPNCGSSGYLTGKTLIQEATEDGGLPTVQFTTAIPGDAPELEAPLTLGA